MAGWRWATPHDEAPSLAGSGGPEESPEVSPLPARGPSIESEFQFLLAEAERVDGAPAIGKRSYSEGAVQHLVIDDIVEKDPRNPRPIESWVDSDDPVVRIVAAEVDGAPPRSRSASSPGDGDLQPRLEVAVVEPVVDFLEVEVKAPVGEVEVGPASRRPAHEVPVLSGEGVKGGAASPGRSADELGQGFQDAGWSVEKHVVQPHLDGPAGTGRHVDHTAPIVGDGEDDGLSRKAREAPADLLRSHDSPPDAACDPIRFALDPI